MVEAVRPSDPPSHVAPPWARLWDRVAQRRGRQMVERVRSAGLTYLSDKKFASILGECAAARQRRSTGVFIEAGCALGGSTVVIADQRPTAAPFWVYDTFEGMPPPTERDSPDVHERYRVISSGQSVGINGATYYGYRKDLEAHVRATLDQHVRASNAQGIQLFKGLVQDTLQVRQAVAFAHIDVDWYDPVMTCIQRIFPHLELGGSLIFDDYSDYQSCRNAVDEYFSDKRDQVVMDTSAGSCRVRRVAAPRRTAP